jgi:hypothetical protein
MHRNTGDPRLMEGSDLQPHRGCGSVWESEGRVVPVKPGNLGGGKGPYFWCAFEEGRGAGDWPDAW